MLGEQPTGRACIVHGQDWTVKVFSPNALRLMIVP